MQGILVTIRALDGTRWTAEFAQTTLTIGHSLDNDIVLEHDSVSSQHCRVLREPSGTFMVEECGSPNGIWIAGHRVSGRERVGPQTTIMVGDYALAFLGLPLPKPMTTTERLRRAAKLWDQAGRPMGKLLEMKWVGMIDLSDPDVDELLRDYLEESVRYRGRRNAIALAKRAGRAVWRSELVMWLLFWPGLMAMAWLFSKCGS